MIWSLWGEWMIKKQQSLYVVYKDAVFTNDDEYSQYVQSQHFTETCHHISSSH